MEFWTIVNHLLSGYSPKPGHSVTRNADGTYNAHSGEQVAREILQGTTPAHPSGKGASWTVTTNKNGTYSVKAETWDSWSDDKAPSEMTDDEYQRFVNGDMF